jgi:hypothetical protein
VSIGGCSTYCHRKGSIHQGAWLRKCKCQKVESIFCKIIRLSLNVRKLKLIYLLFRSMLLHSEVSYLLTNGCESWMQMATWYVAKIVVTLT